MQRLSPESVAICSVVEAELYYGVMNSARPVENLATLNRFLIALKSFPFDSKAARRYGEIRASLARIGALVGPNDLMIAAIAIANDAIVVTHNTREFSRIHSLRIEDWL
jgi:tRNA(fMet)-specific endonuclease VapC